MSHELRTPLNVIIGYASTILDMPTLYENEPLPALYRNDVRLIKDNDRALSVGIVVVARAVADIGAERSNRLASALGATGATSAVLLVVWFVAFVLLCWRGIRWLVVHFWRPINRARRQIDRGIDERVGGVRSQPAAMTPGEPVPESLRDLDGLLPTLTDVLDERRGFCESP